MKCVSSIMLTVSLLCSFQSFAGGTVGSADGGSLARMLDRNLVVRAAIGSAKKSVGGPCELWVDKFEVQTSLPGSTEYAFDAGYICGKGDVTASIRVSGVFWNNGLVDSLGDINIAISNIN